MGNPAAATTTTTTTSTFVQEKGRGIRVAVVSLPLAISLLCAAVLFALAAGRASSRTLLFTKDHTTSLLSFLKPLAAQSQADSNPSTTSSFPWIQVDSPPQACGAGIDNSSDGQNSNDKNNHEQSQAYQLLVDIKEVDANTIESEQKLSELIINFANALNLTVTVYQCHTDPDLRFISCLGALDNGHVNVSIRSSTTERTVYLDVYARDRTTDAEDVQCAERFLIDHFFNQSDDEERGGFDGNISNLRWVLKARGPPSSNHHVLSTPSASVPSQQQWKQVDAQSTRDDNKAYYESLVHPSMFTHKSPKRVAIIGGGGGGGATLREVLKHKTVEQVVMIEIDQIPDPTRVALPEWNDCSNLGGPDEKCMDDRRVEIYTEDASKWFADRSNATRMRTREEEPPFDIIIMAGVL
jgi:hypothetical protein